MGSHRDRDTRQHSSCETRPIVGTRTDTGTTRVIRWISARGERPALAPPGAIHGDAGEPPAPGRGNPLRHRQRPPSTAGNSASTRPGPGSIEEPGEIRTAGMRRAGARAGISEAHTCSSQPRCTRRLRRRDCRASGHDRRSCSGRPRPTSCIEAVPELAHREGSVQLVCERKASGGVQQPFVVTDELARGTPCWRRGAPPRRRRSRCPGRGCRSPARTT